MFFVPSTVPYQGQWCYHKIEAGSNGSLTINYRFVRSHRMYTLRFPFRLPPGQEIAVDGEVIELGDLKFSLERDNRLYILTIDGFPSEHEAKHYINNVWAGLMWVLLQRKLSPDAELAAQKVTYAKDPYQAAKNLEKSFGLQIEGPVDSLIDGARPAVYLTEKKLRVITMGEPNVVVTSPAEDVLRILGEGTSFQRSNEVLEDKKLRVALELYGAYFTEFSPNAKFLTLVVALEALAISVRKTQLVIDLINKWKTELEKLSETVEAKSDDALSLEALSRELQIRKEDSKRRLIQSLVLKTLKDHGDKDAEEMAGIAKEMYDLRSILVHEGWLEPRILSKAISQTRNIVERILLALFAKKAGKSEEGDV